MKYFIGVTDNSWFTFLAALKPDEVNFWRPSGRLFGALDVGAPFLFKLHSPYNYIVGGGIFVKSYHLPLSLAWDAFKEKNGATDPETLRKLINKRRSDNPVDPKIGCTILNEPFFLPRERWIEAPGDWKPNIVTGKTYGDDNPIGRELWERVQFAWIDEAQRRNGLAVAEGRGRYGREYLTKARLGQGAFRILVTEAYGRACAVTGEHTLPVLEAAHIKPFANEGPNRTDNGILLRSDLHILFDRGYLTITPDHRIEISKRIKEEFDNGREYYPYHGKKLQVLPARRIERPGREFIEWHNNNVFVA